jgi:hypothetical protein
MSDAEEIARLREEICRLRKRINAQEADIAVLTFEVESLDRQRRDDIKRFAALRSLD